nr:hypothetical protein [Tanacetum cinerariifolium]
MLYVGNLHWCSGRNVLILEKRVFESERKREGNGIKEKKSSLGNISAKVSTRVNEAFGSNCAASTPNVVTSLGQNLVSELQTDSNVLDSTTGKLSNIVADSRIPNEGGANIHRNSNKLLLNLDVAVSMDLVHVLHEWFRKSVYGFFWTSHANIMKEDMCNFPVWVKFYDIPINSFIEDVLSDIATKLATPLMLASYTSAMSRDS